MTHKSVQGHSVVVQKAEGTEREIELGNRIQKGSDVEVTVGVRGILGPKV
jgi:hypothetical protein